MKILVIEDEPKAAAYVRQGLTEARYVVDPVYDGEGGLAAARDREYSMILCDVMLPPRDGFSLVSEQHAITIKLAAPRALGSAGGVSTDKTETFTEGRICASELWGGLGVTGGEGAEQTISGTRRPRRLIEEFFEYRWLPGGGVPDAIPLRGRFACGQQGGQIL